MRKSILSNHFLALYIPLIISNVLHMIVVKRDLFPNLKTPLNQKLFGKNKTLRGFLFVTVVTALAFIAINGVSSKHLFFGALLGFTYMLFELPNSFAKRRMGIKEGEASSSKMVSFIIDKSDSAFGVSFVYCLLYGLTFFDFIQLFLFAFFIHSFFSFLLLKLSIKEKI